MDVAEAQKQHEQAVEDLKAAKERALEAYKAAKEAKQAQDDKLIETRKKKLAVVLELIYDYNKMSKGAKVNSSIEEDVERVLRGD